MKIEEGRWYTAKIIADGKNYQMSIDGTTICDYQCDLPNSGAAFFFSRNSEIHFDNVVITGDNIPDLDLSVAVDPKAKLATTWATIRQSRP